MRRSILALALFSSATALACDTPTFHQTSERSTTAYVIRPGTYCLDRDVKQYDLFDMHAFSTKNQAGTPLFTVMLERRPDRPPAGDYVIDLGGHALRSEAKDMLGVSTRVPGQSVRILNGKISVPGKEFATAVKLLNAKAEGWLAADLWGVYSSREEYEDVPAAELMWRGKPRYSDEHHVVENLDIQSGYRGIALSGRNNIIRNNRIEVDGHTAIVVYGPGTVIENNTIIVRGRLNRKEWDAAIKLCDADGAIIRNNEIIFEGGLFAQGEVAISLLDSDNAAVAGNTIKGYRQSVRTRGRTTLAENGITSSR